MISIIMTLGFILGCIVGIILFWLLKKIIKLCPSFKYGWILLNLYTCFLFSTLFITSPFIMISCMFGIILVQLALVISDIYPNTPYICVNDNERINNN